MEPGSNPPSGLSPWLRKPTRRLGCARCTTWKLGWLGKLPGVDGLPVHSTIPAATETRKDVKGLPPSQGAGHRRLASHHQGYKAEGPALAPAPLRDLSRKAGSLSLLQKFPLPNLRKPPKVHHGPSPPLVRGQTDFWPAQAGRSRAGTRIPVRNHFSSQAPKLSSMVLRV